MNDIKHLPKPQQKVIAKAMAKSGYSTRQLQRLLGVDDVSVWRATKEATPDELKQFEADFTEALKETKRTGIAMVQKRLLQLVPKEKRIDQVVKAGEYFEGKSTGDAGVKRRIIAEEFFEEKV